MAYDCKDCPKPDGVKCCFNCGRDGENCDVWHHCGSDCTGWEPVDNVIPIEVNSPHDVFEAMCWRCGKRWIAVMPTGTNLKDLECPECHKQGYAFLTGQEITEDEDGK